MAWRCIYENADEFHSDRDAIGGLPTDGILAVIDDGKPYTGWNHYGFAPDGTVHLAQLNSGEGSPDDFPDGTRVVRGKVTTTARMHAVDVELGWWSPDNLKPDAAEPNWTKDVVGWRLWTSTQVFDSIGLGKADWLAHWASLPATDCQIIFVYENWRAANGRRFRQKYSGDDSYFMAPSVLGEPIIFGSQDDEATITRRYPGAVIKAGAQLSDVAFRRVWAEAFKSDMP